MTHEELLKTPEFWTSKIQIELYQKVEQYIEENNITRTELAKRLGVSKGYISQILNGDYDHRISKFVELSLFVGYKPQIYWESIEQSKQEEYKSLEHVLSITKKALQDNDYKYCIMYCKNNTKYNINNTVKTSIVPKEELIA